MLLLLLFRSIEDALLCEAKKTKRESENDDQQVGGVAYLLPWCYPRGTVTPSSNDQIRGAIGELLEASPGCRSRCVGPRRSPTGDSLRGWVWQNHLRNEGFISQDHIRGFSVNWEYTNTSHKAYNAKDMKFK
jgi:hypothetical protein